MAKQEYERGLPRSRLLASVRPGGFAAANDSDEPEDFLMGPGKIDHSDLFMLLSGRILDIKLLTEGEIDEDWQELRSTSVNHRTGSHFIAI